MIKKIILLFALVAFSSCASVRDKVENPLKKCPPAGERTILDILCSE